MSGVSTLSDVVDTEFTQTWYEIRPDAMDNILDATVITAVMKDHGCFKPKSGGRKLERTIRYGEKTVEGFSKGDVLQVGRPELKTAAFWDWRYLDVPVNRTFEDDQQNSGPDKITDYVADELGAARDALAQKFESVLGAQVIHASRASADGTSTKEPESLFDIAPDLYVTNYFSASYEYGAIDRDNAWWQHMDFTDDMSGTASGNRKDNKAGPYALTVYDDLKNVHHTVTANAEAPNLIVTGQEVFEALENIADSKVQLIKEENTRVANLGYQVLQFKGTRVVWSEKFNYATIRAWTGQSTRLGYEALLLNLNYIDIMYDPAAWFMMSSWERDTRSLESVAYIICAMQLVCNQLRRQARVAWDS